jgi:hypothetical protein
MIEVRQKEVVQAEGASDEQKRWHRMRWTRKTRETRWTKETRQTKETMQTR